MRRAWLIVLLGFGACSAPPASVDATDARGLDEDAHDGRREDANLDAPAPPLEIGTGEFAFEALPDVSPTLEIVHGPQGGYHIYLSMRVRGVLPDTLLWRVVREDDLAVLANLDLIAREGTFVPIDGSIQRVGDLVVLNVISPADVLMRDVRIEASVTSRTGDTATAVRVVRIVDAAP